jgi:hypothetical protein
MAFQFGTNWSVLDLGGNGSLDLFEPKTQL